MPVSGVVIRINAARGDQVLAGLEQLKGVEVQPERHDQMLVAVIDADDFETQERLTSCIREIDGVEDLTLAYHNFEDMVDA